MDVRSEVSIGDEGPELEETAENVEYHKWLTVKQLPLARVTLLYRAVLVNMYLVYYVLGICRM